MSMNEKLLAKIVDKSSPEYGNSLLYASGVIFKHWMLDHDNMPGGKERPIECQVCNNLWMRASNAIMKLDAEARTVQDSHGAVPVPYPYVVKRVFQELQRAIIANDLAPYDGQ